MVQPESDLHVKLLARHEHLGIVPGPEVLQFYKGIDQALPTLIVRAIDGQLKREYRYALCGQVAAWMALLLMAGGFVFLVMNGHETPAYVLLGAGVLNTIGGFLRARLSGGARKTGEDTAHPRNAK